MAVRVRGTINIQRKVGRKGDFNIGDLTTEIGQFEVKDALIEQFEPGKYSGEFIIQWIEPDSFSWRGRVFVKNRATLAEILVDEADEGAPPPSTPPEPDPIDQNNTSDSTHAGDTRVPTSHQAAPPARPVQKFAPAGAEGADAQSSDATLFGSEIHQQILAGEAVKMDPTVDRELFRQQRDRLKALGFAFNAMSQTWAPKGATKPLSEAERMALDIPF